jgi:hypothetical protein
MTLVVNASRRGQAMPESLLKSASDREVTAIFIFGVVFVTAILVLAFVFPSPTDMQYLVMRIVLALATAAVATLLTGFINVEIPNFVKAGGAFAVFVIVYWYNPAALVAKPPSSLAGNCNQTVTAVIFGSASVDLACTRFG